MSDKKTILVVDDEKNVTMTLKSFFAALGHEMFSALNGEDALGIIRKDKPALVILDIRMPKIDGIQLIKIIQKEHIKIKIIVISGFSAENKQEVERLGVDGFFDKPVDLEALMDRIKVVLESTGNTIFHSLAPAQTEKPELKVTPKAKILIMEPSPVVLGFTCGTFMNKETLSGDYDVKAVFDASEGMKLIYSFQPDIVIVYDSLLPWEDIKRLAEFMMHTTHRPKTVILHGMFPKTEIEMRELEKLGIKYCNQSHLDNEGMKIINERLMNMVSKECLNHGLVKDGQGRLINRGSK